MNRQDTLGIRWLAVSLVAGNYPFCALTSTPSICFLFLASRFGATNTAPTALAPPSGGGPLFFCVHYGYRRRLRKRPILSRCPILPRSWLSMLKTHLKAPIPFLRITPGYGAARAFRAVPATAGSSMSHLLCAYFLKFAIIFQRLVPGNKHSQNLQPFTGFWVIDTAAADGDEKRSPFTTKAPFSTTPVYCCPL